ncbi:MAG: hypothetical protein WB347_07345 [Terriglobales bacterium]
MAQLPPIQVATLPYNGGMYATLIAGGASAGRAIATRRPILAPRASISDLTLQPFNASTLFLLTENWKLEPIAANGDDQALRGSSFHGNIRHGHSVDGNSVVNLRVTSCRKTMRK